MKKRIRRLWQKRTAAFAVALVVSSFGAAYANPEGGVVRSGAADIVSNGHTMDINQSTNRVAIDWNRFNIGTGERVNFNQPGFDAIALNRVIGGEQSVIDGMMHANGHVFLVNPNGVLFGKSAQLDVGGFVASTAQMSMDQMKDFADGGDVVLAISDSNANRIVNEGTIKAEGGLVALHAASVENSGTIENEGGKTALLAEKTLTLSADTAGKLNFAVDGALASASVLNAGTVDTNGGYVLMTAKAAGDTLASVVNNTGVIEANTLKTNEKGEIVLDSNGGTTNVAGTLSAEGAAEGTDGGSIKVNGGVTNLVDGTVLSASGARNGGKIETSGDVVNFGDKLEIRAKGANGKNGEWLLDPLEVVISKTKPTGAGLLDTNLDGQHGVTGENTFTGTGALSKNTTTWVPTTALENALNNGADITIQATDPNGAAQITVNDPIQKSSSDTAWLTLEAARNIVVNSDIESTGGVLNLAFHADTDGDDIGATILNGNIKTQGGYFTVVNGKNITIDKTNGVTSDKVTDNILTRTSTASGRALGADGKEITTASTGLYVGLDPSGTKTTYNDVSIETNGGNVNIYGDVAVALDGKKFTINTANTLAAQGAKYTADGNIHVTGDVYSGNSYKRYLALDENGNVTEEWKALFKDVANNTNGALDTLLDSMADDNITSLSLIKGDNEYNKKRLIVRAYLNDLTDAQKAEYSSTGKIVLAQGYKAGVLLVSQDANGNPLITQPADYNSSDIAARNAARIAYVNAAYDAIMANVKDGVAEDLTYRSLALMWEAAKSAAQGTTAGGAGVGDTYLATITSALENSVNTTGEEAQVFVGGRGIAVDWLTPKLGVDNLTKPSWFLVGYNALLPDAVTVMEGDAIPEGFTKKSYTVTLPSGTSQEITYYYNDTTGKFLAKKSVDSKGQENTYLVDGNGDVLRLPKEEYGSKAKDGGGYTADTSKVKTHTGMPIKVVDYNGKQDTTHPNGYYWVTGPEGLVTNADGTQGTKFTDSLGNAYDGYVSYWHKGEATWGTDDYSNTVEPGGESSNLSINYGYDAKWDDVNDGKSTIKGFVRETNLTNSAIDFNAGTGNVNLDGVTGRTGVFKLSTVDITGGNVTMHGANATDTIHVTTTTQSGKLSLEDGTDGGALKTDSTAGNAVVLDVTGYNGSFVNNTTAASAITTGEGGHWQVYSASPALNTFGTNLNSETYAIWNASSTDNATETDSNRYIFQVQPTITITADNLEKTYGETKSSADVTHHVDTANATFTTNGKSYSVDSYKQAFDETGLKNRLENVDQIAYESKGFAATATRNGGDKVDENGDAVLASDGKKAIYNVSATQDSVKNIKSTTGYKVDAADAQLEINKKKVVINTEGKTTYGTGLTNDSYTDTPDDKHGNGFVNGDGAKATYNHDTTGGAYDNALKEKQKTNPKANTPDAGTYKNSVKTTVTFEGDDPNNPIEDNYDITGGGDITVDKRLDRPDINHNVQTNVMGNGSITDNRTTNNGNNGVNRVLGLADAQLPFFKNLDGRVSNYGTYDVAVDPDSVKLEPSAKRLPEPDQPRTQYRELMASLGTPAGTGKFKLVYDGSRFIISPVDTMATDLLVQGDPNHNVEIASQALYQAFSNMGILLEDLDAVYINFQ